MTQSDLPFVSIVTPVYNGEKYLDECIRSVRSQTYRNWEYIILNNCSTDSTPSIARRHAEEDERIRIVETFALLPLIQNHNYALRQIAPESKYCKMVHADDFLFPACLEQMVSAAEANPTAGIVGAYSLWGNKVVADGLSPETTFLSGSELSRLTLLDRLYCFWSPSSLLIRSDLIRKRANFYKEDYLHADVMACYELLRDSDFAFVYQVLTYIRKHEESATTVATGDYQRILVSNLDLYLRFGPVFLNTSEYDRHLSFKIRQYYNFLANNLFQLREWAFWRYHFKAMAEIGMPLSYSLLISAAFKNFIGRPLKTIRALLTATKHRFGKGRECC